MRMRSTLFSLISVLFLLLLSGQAGSAYAETAGSVVTVRSKADFIRLASDCALDSWSKGITVEPLFRYVTLDAVINDLNVEGSIAPTYGCLRIGGIAGTNWGLIENCSFSGSVSGLNYVGGIAGENHGTIDRCTFTGSVDGKRFSGGITGYNEGLVRDCVNSGDVNITLTVEALDLEDLATASNGLALNLLNAEDANIISDTGGIVGFSKGIVVGCSNTGMIGYPHYGYNVGGIAGRQSGYLSGCRNSGQIYGKKDVAGIVGQMEPYLDLVKTTNLADELLLLNKYLNNASGDIANLATDFRNLQNQINTDLREEEYDFGGYNINEGVIYHADEPVPSDSGSGSEGSISGGGSGSEGSISGGGSGDSSSGTIQGISDWINDHTGGNISTDNLPDYSVDFDGLSDEFNARMNELAGRLGNVYGVLQSSGGDLAYDLTLANSEQQGETATEGLVSGNENYGAVEADNNVGGIAGAMGIEYEFDLEDSLAQIVGANGIVSNTYSTNCVNSGNVNYASVQGKKDRIGGAVGSEESGTVMNCESYGSISSTDGNYVGGIAGYSSTSIHKSYAFCLVNGSRYVGGVAGSGKDIWDSVSMIETESSGAFIGAIAGWADMDEEDSVTGNLYVHDSLGAIDGISYVSRAEPISYEELITMPDIPAGFRQVTLNFFVDGRLIDTLRADFGGSVDESLIPAVPARAGYTGSWSDFDHENIRFSRDIEAVYTLNHSTIASEQTREDSPLSVALLEGSFTDDDTLSLTPYQDGAPSIPEHRAVETWEITLSGSDRPDAEYTVRYQPPEVLQVPEWNSFRLPRTYLPETGPGSPDPLSSGSQYLPSCGPTVPLSGS